MDPHPYSLLDPDPHSVCRFGSGRENNYRKLFMNLFFTNFVKLDLDPDLDPDPDSEKRLDPDPQKMNADPQPCR